MTQMTSNDIKWSEIGGILHVQTHPALYYIWYTCVLYILHMQVCTYARMSMYVCMYVCMYVWSPRYLHKMDEFPHTFASSCCWAECGARNKDQGGSKLRLLNLGWGSSCDRNLWQWRYQWMDLRPKGRETKASGGVHNLRTQFCRAGLSSQIRHRLFLVDIRWQVEQVQHESAWSRVLCGFAGFKLTGLHRISMQGCNFGQWHTMMTCMCLKKGSDKSFLSVVVQLNKEEFYPGLIYGC